MQPMCALGLYFFSDGGPSDIHVFEDYRYKSEEVRRNYFLADLKNMFRRRVKFLSENAKKNGIEFIFKTCGFGND